MSPNKNVIKTERSQKLKSYQHKLSQNQDVTKSKMSQKTEMLTNQNVAKYKM